MEDHFEDAQRRKLLSVLLTYQDWDHVRATLAVADEVLVGLLDGTQRWTDEVWERCIEAWKPFEALSVEDSANEMSDDCAVVEDSDGGDYDLHEEEPGSSVSTEPVGAIVAAPTQEQLVRRRSIAGRLGGRRMALAALYGDALRRHEKLAVFRFLLEVEAELILLFEMSLPVLSEEWSPKKRQREIERRSKLMRELAQRQKSMHSGPRGWFNCLTGHGKVDEKDVGDLVAQYCQSMGSLVSIDSDPRVMAGDYLRWDWY